MNFTFKSIFSLLLCLSLCLGMAIPGLALDTANTDTAADYTAVLSADTLPGGKEQLVTLTVNAIAPQTLCGIGAQVTWDDALTLVSVENATPGIDFSSSVNLNTGLIVWDGNADLSNMEGVSNIATITFKAPADIAIGSYAVGLTDIVLFKDYVQPLSTGGSASATLTITAPPAPEVTGYTAKLFTPNTTPTNGETVYVHVNVGHSEDTVYAAGELTFTFTSGVLAFNKSKSTLPANTGITAGSGTVKLADYGENKALQNGAYVLAFDTTTYGEASVTLTDAAFTNKENAVSNDLIAAELSDAVLALDVQKKVFSITLPEEFIGNPTAEEGAPYSFSIPTDSNYIYSNVTAAVNGQPVAVNYNEQTKLYSIAAVNGNLVITVDKTPKTYGVTIQGEVSGTPAESADYGTDYTFTLKDNVSAGLASGANYKLESITIGGKAYTDFAVQGRTYTIHGKDITGDIVITVSKETLAPNMFTVTVNTEHSSAVESYPGTVNKGSSATLVLNQIKGYVYTVTAKMGNGEEQTLEGTMNAQGKYEYTVSNVTANLTFTVTRTVYTDGMEVDHYLTLKNGTDMYLVLKNIDVEANTVPTFDGKPMFWSANYDAYCYLVIGSTPDLNDLKTRVDLAEGIAIAVDYGMDVNKSGKVDAADAQLAYDMYNAEYTAFDENVTMEKLLRADVNSSKGINTDDAVAIINSVLGIA